MDDNKNTLEEKVGELHKQREPMPDGKRYIIFYTFGAEKIELLSEENENV